MPPVPAPAITDAPPAQRGNRARGATITPIRARGVVTQPEHRHRSKDVLPFLGETDLLSVQNIDDVTWEFKWDRRTYTIAPGKTDYVPFPTLVIKMGDPRSMPEEQVKFRTDDGRSGVVFTRHESLCTLFAHYAIENFDLDALVEFAPKLVTHTMEGDLVTWPAQDPEMIAFPVPQAVEPGKENSDQRRLMDRLNAENADMRSELAEMRALISEKLGGGTVADVPGDGGEDPDEPTGDDLAAALTGASVDSGPATRLR